MGISQSEAGLINMRDIVLWKTVRLGRYKDSHGYLAALRGRGLVVGRIAREAVEKITVSASAVDVRVVRVSGATLDLTGNATLQEICDSALAAGLRLCDAEVAPALREQYADQPKGEILWIAMQPIVVSSRDSGVLCVGHDSRGQWLSLGCGSGCSWGRWRQAMLDPETQTRVIPMSVCECPWSRGPITAIFEKGSC